MRTLYSLGFLFHLFSIVDGQTKVKVDQNEDRFGHYAQRVVLPLKHDEWTKTDAIQSDIQQLRSLLKNGIFEFLQIYSEPRNAFDFNVSKICFNDTLKIISNPYSNYSQRMIDADFKIPSGVLDGNIRWLGSYDQCVSDKTHLSLQGQRFSSKYCLVSFPISKSEISLGTCLPSTCNSKDAKGLINTVLSLVNISASHSVCVEEKPFTTGAVVALTICMVLFFLILTGTVAEVFFMYFDAYTARKIAACKKTNVNCGEEQYTERTGLLSGTTSTSYTKSVSVAIKEVPKVNRCRIIMAFSIITNTKKLMNTSTANSPLACLNGMRVISMWWIILGHTYSFVIFFLDNPLEAFTILQRFSFQAILNGTFSVDTFFFMSGILVVYNCLNMMRENNGKMKWHIFYIHRYWRLTPAYAFVLMVFASLTMYMGTGPFFSYFYDDNGPFMYQNDECSRTWWANILYINNFYPNFGNLQKQCMGWSWYLANDMQFYIFSPIIIVLLYKWKMVGIIMIGILIFCCIFIRCMLSYFYGIYIPYTQTATLHLGDVYAKNDVIYNKPYTRMSTYLVGMLVGWCLHHNKCRLRIPKLIVLIGWCVAVAIGMAVIYGLYDYYQVPPQHASLGISVFYVSVSRFAWGVALAWVTVACATGHGGPVNHILSWKIWAPLGRLTYCAYLVHPVILFLYTLGLTTPFHYTDWTMIHLFLANLVVSYAVAYIVSMAVEAPMLGLEKLMFKR